MADTQQHGLYMADTQQQNMITRHWPVPWQSNKIDKLWNNEKDVQFLRRLSQSIWDRLYPRIKDLSPTLVFITRHENTEV